VRFYAVDAVELSRHARTSAAQKAAAEPPTALTPSRPSRHDATGRRLRSERNAPALGRGG